MVTIGNLKDFIVEGGRELYDANQQELKGLKNLEMQATASGLKKLIQKKAQHTKSQQQHLLEALNLLRENHQGGRCEPMQTMLKRAQQFSIQSKTNEIRDVAIISSLQQLSHFKIAALGNGASHAREIGQEKVAQILHDALLQEKEIDNELSCLAQLVINKTAV